MRRGWCAGGYEFDGSSEIAPLDEQQLRRIARRILAAGIRCAVVSGVFSPVQAAQEQRAAVILADEAAAADAEADALGGAIEQRQQQQQECEGQGQGQGPLLVCQSHEVGRLGLLERENAAVLNAALQPLARRVVPACVAALAAAGIQAPLFFTANDGTLLSAQDALKVRWRKEGRASLAAAGVFCFLPRILCWPCFHVPMAWQALTPS